MTGDLLTPDELKLTLEAVGVHLPSSAEVISDHVYELANRKLWLERRIYDALLTLREMPETMSTGLLTVILESALEDA